MQGEGGDAHRKGPGGFKGEREAERRSSAGNRTAWNTLFMRADTVAAAVAEHYGVSRAELLDRDAAGAAKSGSFAVRFLYPEDMRTWSICVLWPSQYLELMSMARGCWEAVL